MPEQIPLMVDAATQELRQFTSDETIPQGQLLAALQVALTGLDTSNVSGVLASDTILRAIGKLQAQASGKVDKVAGKVLSSNDFTNTERVKLANIAEHATANATDTALRDRSTHTGTQPITTITGVVGAMAGGAIIERGSNANGEYVRFADGTQICTAAIYLQGPPNISVGGVYHTPDQVWTFPSGFISQPKCSGIEAAGVGGCWIARGLSTQTQITATQYGFSAVRGATAYDNPSASLTAIGRWK